jgi:hypothetical protein
LAIVDLHAQADNFLFFLGNHYYWCMRYCHFPVDEIV